MNWLIQHEESIPEYWLLLRPTTPLREPKIINNAVEKIQLIPEASSLRSGYPAPESPYKWFLRDQKGFFQSLSGDLTPDMANLPRQQYPATYIPDGYIDIVRSSHVLNKNTLFGDRMFVFESPCTTDFDTKEDFEYLEFQIRQKGNGPTLAQGIMKKISKLDIAERRLPQDGASTFKSDTKEVDLRVSILPTKNNERIVMRILNKDCLLYTSDAADE